MWQNICLIICICTYCHASPITDKSTSSSLDDLQLIHNHVISLDRFQSLLRRAGEIFLPLTQEETSETIVKNSRPKDFLQPPGLKAFDYYQPLFENTGPFKSDEKSLHLEYITPPPAPKDVFIDNFNYYAVKPKKLPKKFDNAIKQVNMKWLNAFEKATGGTIGEVPKAIYLANDEKNRINFDDSFFAVDMNFKTPENELRKETQENMQMTGEQNKHIYLEDLMAVAAAQSPQISPNYVP